MYKEDCTKIMCGTDSPLPDLVKKMLCMNKSAQRALCRSPEEKVKGNSGANYREPQGHNLNNFRRGPFDDAIY